MRKNTTRTTRHKLTTRGFGALPPAKPPTRCHTHQRPDGTLIRCCTDSKGKMACKKVPVLSLPKGNRR